MIHDCISGDPGSKPFPEFIPHRESGEQSVSKPVKNKLVTSDNINRISLSKKEFRPSKITPVKRTRFRSKDKKKIVLKRRKVKRLRTKALNSGRSKESKNDIILGFAPEAHRGGSLAELALATLSEEEISREKLGSTPRNRDLLIMKSPESSKKNRSEQKFLTFPTTRLKLALLSDNALKRGNTFSKLNTNAIKIRNKEKTIKKTAIENRLRNPDSVESSPISSPEDHAGSPFPNFPRIINGNDTFSGDDITSANGGDEIPIIGFEEFKLTPKKTLEELNLDSESFLPILKPETNSRNQQFPIVSAVPTSEIVSDVTTLHFSKPQPTTEIILARPQIPQSPVKGDPLPVSTFFDYGDEEVSKNAHEPVEAFPNFPFPPLKQPPAPPSVPTVPDSPPFPDIFNSPRPDHPGFPPPPSVATTFPTTNSPPTTPQPIFQNQPEQPKSNPPPFTFFQPINKGKVNIIAPDAGKMKSHAATVVGNSVMGEIAYVDIDGQEKLLSYKKPSPLPPLLPAFLTQEPDLPVPVPRPAVPNPEEPPLYIRHHGSTLVPRLLPTPAPAPAQASVKPPLVPASQPAPLTGHSRPPAGPGSRPTVLPAFTPTTSYVRHQDGSLAGSVEPGARPRFEPHPRLLSPVAPPLYQTPFRRPAAPPQVLVPRLPALTFLPPRPARPQAQLITTIRPTLVTTTSPKLIQPRPHHHQTVRPPPHPSSGPSRAPFVVTQRFPSPSPIPLIWKPSGAVFTPKPFVHIHTTVVPIVIKTTRASLYSSSSPLPYQPASASPQSPLPPVTKTFMSPQFTTPHPHFFTTPYPQTPYPPLKYFPSRLPAVHLPAKYPYNGHAFPAHVSFARRSDNIKQASDLLTGASETGRNNISVVRPPDFKSADTED